MKQLGCVGVDRSGSFSEIPIVIVAVYGQQSDFSNAMKMVRKIVSREKRILSAVKELKARDIKSRSVQFAVFEELSKFRFRAASINSSVLEILAGQFRPKQDYLKKIEAVFWSRPIRQLLSELAAQKLAPKRVYLDYNFGNEKDQRHFQENICFLSQDAFFISPFIVSAESHSQDALMIADFIAGLLRKNRELAVSHKSRIETLREEEVRNELEKIFKI